MISTRWSRAWLLVLVGASAVAFSPRSAYADSESNTPQRQRSEQRTCDRDREDRCDGAGQKTRESDDRGEKRDGSRREQNKAQRNMHPELQIAAPFGSKNQDG